MLMILPVSIGQSILRVEIVSHRSGSIVLPPCPLDTRGLSAAVTKADNVICRAYGVPLSLLCAGSPWISDFQLFTA